MKGSTVMSKKIIFKGNPYGSFQPFEPDLELLTAQECEPDKTVPEFQGDMAKGSFDGKEEVSEGNVLLKNELRQASLLMAHFKKKNIMIGIDTALSLCRCEGISYTVKAFDTENALPRRITLSRKEIRTLIEGVDS